MKRLLALLTLLSAVVAMVACGGASSTNLSQSNSGAVYVTGEDAPLPSVVGFQVTINSITLNGQSNSPQLLQSPETVDFARLVGLRSPLGFNSVPPDTYASATFVLANPVISYVNLGTTPPTVNMLNGTLPQTPFTLTVNFPTAMVVGSNGLAGLKMDMDIRQSLAVDGNGQITGAVNPVIYIKATKASDPDALITDLTGGLVSVSGNSFVIQGPYGRQLTVDVNNSTQFNSGWSINNLATPAIVSVEGTFQADGSLLATEVEVITTSQSFISGRVLQVTPSSGAARSLSLWVGETGADMVSDIDTIQTVDIANVTTFDVCFMDNWVTNILFNDQSIAVGQRIFIGGSFSNSVFTPEMVSLRRQGVYGMLVPGSVSISNGNAGSYEINNNGLIGYSAGGPLTVDTSNLTLFFNVSGGLSGLASQSSAVPVITRGLVLKDQSTGNLVMWAGLVAEPPSQ